MKLKIDGIKTNLAVLFFYIAYISWVIGYEMSRWANVGEISYSFMDLMALIMLIHGITLYQQIWSIWDNTDE